MTRASISILSSAVTKFEAFLCTTFPARLSRIRRRQVRLLESANDGIRNRMPILVFDTMLQNIRFYLASLP